MILWAGWEDRWLLFRVIVPAAPRRIRRGFLGRCRVTLPKCLHLSCVSLSRLPFLHATPPALTFQKVAPLLPDSEWPSLSKEQAEAEWIKVTPSVRAWQQLLRETPEASWKAWSSAANAFLLQTGKTCATPGTRERGTVPKLINAGARVAPGQPLRERQLRRLIRRLDEIRHLEIEQYPLPPDLVRGVHVGTSCTASCKRHFVNLTKRQLRLGLLRSKILMKLVNGSNARLHPHGLCAMGRNKALVEVMERNSSDGLGSLFLALVMTPKVAFVLFCLNIMLESPISLKFNVLSSVQKI